MKQQHRPQHRPSPLLYTGRRLTNKTNKHDPASILLGSSPALCRSIAGIASAADNRVVMFLGNSEEGVVLFVVPDDALGRLSDAEAVDVAVDTDAHHATCATLGAGVNHIPIVANNAASEGVRPRRSIVLVSKA